MLFYDHDGRFTAVCDNTSHGHCVLTRYKTLRSAYKGRPCGFLVAWWAAGPFCEDKQKHRKYIGELETKYNERLAARTMLRDMPCGQALLDHELPAAADAPTEPPTVCWEHCYVASFS